MSQEDQPNPSPDAPSTREPSPHDLPESDAQPFVITLPDDPSSGNDWYLWAGVLALLTLVAFWPAITGIFLWDDDHQLTLNQTGIGLLHIWVPKLETIQYYPLTNTLLWIEDHLWGTDQKSALGFHVVNLILHATGAIILWRALRRLSVPAAWVAAAAWAIHPLQAETVCWISELKNVLSGVLLFASLLFFLEFIGLRDPDARESDMGGPDSREMVWKLKTPWQAYGISLAFFVLAMFSKTVASSLAPALLFIMWWKQRLGKERVLALLPYFVIGAALSLCTALRESDPNGPVEAAGEEWNLGFIPRLLIAARGFWFYIGKTLVPINLSFNYPRIVPSAGDPMHWMMLIAALLLIALLYVTRDKIGRGPLTAILCYFVALFPSLGFFNVFPFRYSFVADHFQYLAGVPLIALLVAIAARAIVKIIGAQRFAEPATWQAVLPAILVGLLAITAWVRASVFVAPPTLWSDVLAKNPNSWLAAYNFAKEERGEAVDDITNASRAFQSGDPDLAKNQIEIATALLDDAEKNLSNVLHNPQVPARLLQQALNELADLQLSRAGLGGADVIGLADRAESYAIQAIESEKLNDERHRDPAPYYTVGKTRMVVAETLQRSLLPDGTTRPSPATRAATQATSRESGAMDSTALITLPSAADLYPTTLPSSEVDATTRPSPTGPATTRLASTTNPTTRMAATRPATPAEQRAIDAYNQARSYFQQALEVADIAGKYPNIRPIAVRIFALAAFQHANVDTALAGMARNRDDITAMEKSTREAINFYLTSLKVNPFNIQAHYYVAKCLVQFGYIQDAKNHLKVALLYAPNHQYAQAYDELGILMIADPRRTLDDVLTAVQCFRDAVSISPSDPEFKQHLSWAQAMESTAINSRPSTIPSSATEPSTRRSAVPTSQP